MSDANDGDGNDPHGPINNAALEQASVHVKELVDLVPQLGCGANGIVVSVLPDDNAAAVIATAPEAVDAVTAHAIFASRMPSTSGLFIDIYDALMELAELGLDDTIIAILQDFGKTMQKHYEPAVKSVAGDDQ